MATIHREIIENNDAAGARFAMHAQSSKITSTKMNDHMAELDYVLAVDDSKKASKLVERVNQVGFDTETHSGANSTTLVCLHLQESDLDQNTRQQRIAAKLHECGITAGAKWGIQSMFPTSKEKEQQQLWRESMFLQKMNVDDIRESLGEEIGLYFEFMNYSMSSFVFPASLGLAAQLLVGSYSIVITSLNLVWAAYFVVGWRFREHQLRPQFKVTSETNTACSNYRGTPLKTVQLRRLVALPLCFGLGLAYIGSLLIVLYFEIFATQFYNGPLKKIVQLMPVGANTVLSLGFDVVYRLIMKRLVEWEDHPFLEEKRQFMVLRQFYSKCLINFAPLMLSAYVYLPWGNIIGSRLLQLHSLPGLERVPIVQNFQLDVSRLSKQTFYYAVTNQLIILGTDGVLPLVLDKLIQIFRPDKGPATDAPLRHLQNLPEYDVNLDYLAIASLFGYAMITSPVWPLAPLAAFIGLYARRIVSATRIAYASHLPPYRDVASIGVWNSILLFLAGLASVVAPTLCIMYRQPSSPTEGAGIVSAAPFIIFAVALFSENIFLVVTKMLQSSVHSIIETEKILKVQ